MTKCGVFVRSVLTIAFDEDNLKCQLYTMPAAVALLISYSVLGRAL